VRAPLHPAYGILVSHQVALVRAPDRRAILCHAACAELHHAAIPDAHGLVNTPGSEDQRAILVPVEAEHLAARGRDREGGSGERGGECVGGWGKGGSTEVK